MVLGNALSQRLIQFAKGFPTLRKLYYRARRPFHAWRFISEFFQFRKIMAASPEAARFSLSWQDLYPCVNDRTSTTSFDRHYIYHPAWAARVLACTRPAKHVDISSSLAFVSMVSAFVSVEFYDYRPADLRLSGLDAKSANLMKLPFSDGTVDSLSCMHVVEHVGLGRYGDSMDAEGDLKAIAELKRVLAPGGDLLFVVPIGGQARIQFNAHRIYTSEQIKSYFSDLKLEEFSLIPEFEKDGGLVKNPSDTLLSAQTYGCGCFWFKKV